MWLVDTHLILHWFLLLGSLEFLDLRRQLGSWLGSVDHDIDVSIVSAVYVFIFAAYMLVQILKVMGRVVTRGVVHAELAGASHMLVAAAAEVIRVGPAGANWHEVAEKRFTLQPLKGLLILHSIPFVNYIRKERI